MLMSRTRGYLEVKIHGFLWGSGFRKESLTVGLLHAREAHQGKTQSEAGAVA